MPRKVGHLALLAAVGDGVTSGALGELLLPSDGLVTLKTFLTVRQWLNVGFWHLSAKLLTFEAIWKFRIS